MSRFLIAVAAACLAGCASAPPSPRIDLTPEQDAKCKDGGGCVVIPREVLDELLTNVLQHGIELGKAMEKQDFKERT